LSILLFCIQSINQSNQIYIASYVASESEARVGGGYRRSVHVHCNYCLKLLTDCKQFHYNHDILNHDILANQMAAYPAAAVRSDTDAKYNIDVFFFIFEFL